MRPAKSCPVCGSRKLQWVYYAVPSDAAPDQWEYDEDGYSPLILFKRIECAECVATVGGLSLTLDEALDYWNSLSNLNVRYVLQKIGIEPVKDMEETE